MNAATGIGEYTKHRLNTNNGAIEEEKNREVGWESKNGKLAKETSEPKKTPHSQQAKQEWLT